MAFPFPWVLALAPRPIVSRPLPAAKPELLLRGTVSWPGFGKGGADWFGFVFRIDRFRGRPFAENPEGTLEWVDVARVPELPLWEGDRYFLPLVFERTARQFHGVMPYRDGRPVGWSYSVV